MEQNNTPIADIALYNKRMSASLLDKLWWLNLGIIDDDITTIIDFGCADGALGSLIRDMFPNRFHYIGIDNNPDMLLAARANGHEAYPDLDMFFRAYGSISVETLSHGILLLNSVLHEIISEGEFHNIILQRLFTFPVKYIAIREMFLDQNYGSMSQNTLIEHANRLIEEGKIPKEHCEIFRKFGRPINTPRGFIDYLFKYKYVNNFEREIKENYFAFEGIQYYNRYWKGFFKIKSEERYQLPYLKKIWEEDFGVSLDGMETHQKILMKSILREK